MPFRVVPAFLSIVSSLLLHQIQSFQPSFYFHFPTPRPGVVLYGKDWDAILADDDDGTVADDTFVPRDMQYNERNCGRSARNYQAIREAGGDTADIYGCVKSTTTADDAVTFWYLGKAAWVSGVTQAECLQRQWNLIQHHAANLRPLELFATASAGDMAVWCAPGDSEMDVAYQRPHVSMEQIEQPVGEETTVIAKKIPNTFVGFQGEVYEGGEEGFRVWRRASDGGPGRPEIVGPPQDTAAEASPISSREEFETPTDEQMAKLQEALKGKDINQVYEEQERRRREAEKS